MHLQIQTFIGQLPIGALYALVSVGFVTIFRANRVFNLAQGGLSLIGGYLCYTFATEMGLDFGLTVLLTVIASAAIGVLLYQLIFRPLFGQRPVLLLMISLGINLGLGGLTLMIWGTDTKFIKTPSWLNGAWDLGDNLILSRISVATLGVAVVLISAFALVVRFTRFGLTMRAASESPSLAITRGVRLGSVAGVSWAVAVAFGAVAGIAYGAQQGLAPGASGALGSAALPAVVIGGLDSVAGALVGSLILAEVQGFTTIHVGGAVSEVVGYMLLLGFLIARPTGIFGRREIVRL
jgi:branched-chain amino acid transport system permease protein